MLVLITDFVFCRMLVINLLSNILHIRYFSVKTIEVHRYKVGDMIKLNLMRRDKGNTIPVAKSVWIGLPSKPFNVKGKYSQPTIK